MRAREQERGHGTTPRRLLLATDLSCRCDRAQDRAVQLARDWGARLHLVHVLERETEQGGHAAAETLAERAIRAATRDGALDAEVTIRRGNPADIILKTAEELDCDVIVTGIARAETLTRAVLGTTVERLVHRAPMPVLVVKNRAGRPYDRIVVGSDFSASSAHAFRAALRLFPAARMTLLHAYRVPFEGFISREANRDELHGIARGACARFLADLGVEEGRGVECLIEYGSPDELIGAHAWAKELDLVVLGTHGSSGVFDILIGSTAERLLERVPSDVLIVREPRSLPAARAAAASA